MESRNFHSGLDRWAVSLDFIYWPISDPDSSIIDSRFRRFCFFTFSCSFRVSMFRFSLIFFHIFWVFFWSIVKLDIKSIGISLAELGNRRNGVSGRFRSFSTTVLPFPIKFVLFFCLFFTYAFLTVLFLFISVFRISSYSTFLLLLSIRR